MAICRVCFKNIPNLSWDSAFLQEPILCSNCLAMMKPSFKKEVLEGLTIYSLYEYNDFIRSLLYQFKGCFDYALKDVFFLPSAFLLSLYFHSYIMLPAPSAKENDKKRGYNHVEEMFSSLCLPMLSIFEKKDSLKQSDCSLKERKEVKKRILCKEVDCSHHYLLVDDVCTTGSTLLAMRDLLQEKGVKHIKAFVMARTKWKKNKAKIDGLRCQ